jgi:hypothetical protein
MARATSFTPERSGWGSRQTEEPSQIEILHRQIWLRFLNVRTNLYCDCVLILRHPAQQPESAPRASPGIPFPGPETALAATIEAALKESSIHEKTTRPGACQAPPTTFQRLARRLNDLRLRGGKSRDSSAPRLRSAVGMTMVAGLILAMEPERHAVSHDPKTNRPEASSQKLALVRQRLKGPQRRSHSRALA